MQLLAALLRRGVQPSTAACCRPAGVLQPWDGLPQALSTLSMGLKTGAEPGSEPQPAGQGDATAAAATSTSRPSAQWPGQGSRNQTAGCKWQAASQPNAAQHNAVLQLLQQQMQEALARGECGEVLRLLPPDSAAAASGWGPVERAALFDLALRAAADSADLEEARRLVGRMWRQSVPVGVVAHTAMLRALCSVGRHADALAYLQRVPSKRQRTHMFTMLLRACNDAGVLGVAQQCYALFQRRQHSLDAQLSSEVVRLLGASSDVPAAEAAWEQALAAATADEEQARLHAARVAALAKAGQLEAAVAAVHAMLDRFADLLPVDASFTLGGGGDSGGSGRQAVQPSPVRYMQEARNEVLAAAQAAGDYNVARHVASMATLRGLPPNLGTYHSLLRAALAHGDGLAAVQDGVEEMRRLGMQPSRETFSILLKACAAERDPHAAQYVFDAMPADGVAQTRVHYNALLHIYSHAGDLQGVDATYRRMRATGFAPDASTFRALLSSIRHWATHEAVMRADGEGPSSQIERTLHRQQAGVMLAGWVADLDAARPCQLNPGLFVTLLHAYSHSGEILNVLLLMRDALGCQLTLTTSRVVGRSASSTYHGGSAANNAPTAKGGGADSEAAPGSSIASNSGDASSNAAGGGGAGSSSQGDQGRGGRAAGGVAATAGTVLPPGGSASSSSSDGSASVPGPLSRTTLERAQLAPTLPMFNAAIGACTRVGRWHLADGVVLLHSMMAAGLAPDVHTYTSLISGCAFGRQAALARELWRQMAERSIRPTIVTHNAMLKVEVFTYGVDAGIAFLRGMVQQGVQPDRATWRTMLAAARYSKRSDIAEVALAALAGQRGEEEAEGEAAPQLEEAVAAPGVADDHRWHGYYEQQDEEEEW